MNGLDNDESLIFDSRECVFVTTAIVHEGISKPSVVMAGASKSPALSSARVWRRNLGSHADSTLNVTRNDALPLTFAFIDRSCSHIFVLLFGDHIAFVR